MTGTTATNIAIIGGTQLFTVLMTQIVLIVLVHFLNPSDFGIYAVCQVVINLALAISSFGLEEAAIQTRDEPDKAVSTASSLRLVLAVVTVAVVFIASPFIAGSLGIKEAKLPLQVLSISFVLAGLAFVPRVRLKRELRFDRLALSSIVYAAVWAGSALVLAVLDYGYWALVYAFLIATAASCVALWAMRRSEIELRIDRAQAKRLMAFGRYIMATNIVVFLLFNLDKLAIGRILGSADLGVYWLAVQYGTLPAFFITGVTIYVVFPEYVGIAADMVKLRTKHRKVLQYVSLVAFPIGIGMACISPSFVEVLLGPDWDKAVLPLSILSCFGVLYALTSASGIIFISTGNTRQMFRQNIVMFVPFAVVLVPVVYKYELVGVAVLFVGIFLIQLAWVMRSICRILSYSPVEDLKPIYALPVAASAAMAAVLLGIWYLAGTSLYLLIIQIVVGIGVYCAVLIAATKGAIVGEVRGIVRSVRARLPAPDEMKKRNA